MQINKIWNEKGNITTEIEEIQKIIRSYYKSQYSTNLENLDEMDNFLDRYQVPRLNQDQINHLNSPITPKEIQAVIRSILTKRRPSRVLADVQRRPNTNTSQTTPQNINRRNTTQFFL
jgi:conjugal transfer/entry exclusion protein